MANIYGVETLSKSDIDEIIMLYTNASGYYGPVVEKNGKYYLTTLKTGIDPTEIYEAQLNGTYKQDDYYGVAAVLNKSVTKNELLSTINNSQIGTNIQYDVDDLDEYIKEIESATGKEISHVDLGKDNKLDLYFYDEDNNITEVKGIEIKEQNDTNTDNKYDIQSVINQVGSTEKHYANETLNDENKVAVENYLNELTGNDSITIKRDVNGNYIVTVKVKKIVNDEEVEEEKILAEFSENITLSEAIYQVKDNFEKEKDLNGFTKGNESNRSKSRKNSGRIFIDVDAFAAVQGSNSGAKQLIEQGKSGYNAGMLMDKLASFYSGLVGGSSPVDDLSSAGNLLSTLNTNIKYSLQAYDNIDHKLGAIINSIINEIFSMGKYQDDETRTFYESDLLVREKYLGQVIDNLAKQIDNLTTEYEKKYANGHALANVPSEVEALIMGVANAFGFVIGAENDYAIPGISLLDTVEFIQENDLLGKLDSYADGKTWETSGLKKLYETYNTNGTENNFLDKYVFYQMDSKFDSIKQNGAGQAIYELGYSYQEDDINLIKSHMRVQLDKLKSTEGTFLNNETGKNQTYKSLDLLNYYANDAKAYDDAISTAIVQKKNYEMYQKIMPYEADMQGDLYLEYLTQDWSKLDLSDSMVELGDNIYYMSQSEIALYCMYKGIPLNNGTKNNNISEEKASGYINAMQDLINQRHGLDAASERYEQYVKWVKEGGTGGINAFLKTGVDGFSDGVESFFAGINNCLLSDGIKSYQDYRDMYMLSLLDSGESTLDIDMDSTTRNLLKRNYTVLKSVGNMTIPTLVSFIPAVGPYASRGLIVASSFGSSLEMAKQGGSDPANAYLYAGVSSLSTLALNKLLSGIRGLNGNITPTSGVMDFVSSMGMQGGRAVAGMYVDALWRSSILGQPVDLSNLSAESFDSAINGLLTAAILNGTTKLSIKLADGLVYNFGDKYNSYQDLLKANVVDLKSEIKNSSLFQKLKIDQFIGGDSWKQQSLKYNKTILGKWLDEEYSNENLMDVTESVKSHLKIGIQDGQRIIYDNDTKNYYIHDQKSGGSLTVPDNWISLKDTPLHITPTFDEQLFGVTLRKGEEAADTVGMNYWANEIAPKLLKKYFEISDEKVKSLIASFKYYTSEEWSVLLEKGNHPRSVCGMHDRNSNINFMLVDDVYHAMHTTFHEMLHGVGFIKGPRAFNEALTEKFALDISHAEGILPLSFSNGNKYEFNSNALNKIIDANIEGLTLDDFKTMYFDTHDPSSIINAMNIAAREEEFYALHFLMSFEVSEDCTRSLEYRSTVVSDMVDDLINRAKNTTVIPDN